MELPIHFNISTVFEILVFKILKLNCIYSLLVYLFHMAVSTRLIRYMLYMYLYIQGGLHDCFCIAINILFISVFFCLSCTINVKAVKFYRTIYYTYYIVSNPCVITMMYPCLFRMICCNSVTFSPCNGTFWSHLTNIRINFSCFVNTCIIIPFHILKLCSKKIKLYIKIFEDKILL